MRVGLVIFAACALLAIGWLIIGSSEVESPRPVSDTRSPSESSPPPVETAALSREQALAVSGAVTEASQKQDDVILIRLVRGDTGEAIPNHELWFVQSLGRISLDREAAIKASGKSIRSNAEGIARIENAPRQLNLFARKDHLVGSLWLDPEAHRKSGEAYATLELHPESIIFLRALKANGMPAPGVWLHCTLLKEDLTPANRAWGASTDEGGQAEWKHFGIFMHEAQQNDRGPFGGLRVKAYIPGDEEVTLDITPIPTHGQSFDLQLRPTGSLSVRFLDSEGELLVGKHIIELNTLEQDKASGEWKRGPKNGQAIENGVAVFPAVALNSYFEVSAQAIWWPKLRREILGPTSEELSVSHDLMIEDSRVVLRGRALDGSGQALSKTRLRGDFKTSKESFTYFADTDAIGRFVAVFPEAVASATLSKAIFELRGHAPVDLGSHSPFQAGVTDIGRIVFADQVALLSGDVISPPDAACTSIRFKVEQRLPNTEKWRGIDTKTERDGAKFKIMGSLSEGEFRLQATSLESCYVPLAPIPFVLGQEGLTIRLEAGHRLLANVQMATSAHSLAAVPLTFLLRPIAGPAYEKLTAKQERGFHGNWLREGTQTLLEVEWQSLRPGTYELEAHFADGLPPLETVQAIQIPSPDGEPIHLQLDLSEELEEYLLHLSTPDGVAPNGWSLAVLELRGEKIIRSIYSCKTGENEIRVIVPPRVFDLWIMAPGYQSMHLQALDGDRDVILTASEIDIAISLHQSTALPDGVGLMIHSESQEGMLPDWQQAKGRSRNDFFSKFRSATLHRDNNWPKAVSGMLGSNGVAELTLHRAGSQTIRVELVPTNTERRATWPKEKIWIDAVSPARFDAQANGTAQSIQISIPTAALEAALLKAGVQ